MGGQLEGEIPRVVYLLTGEFGDFGGGKISLEKPPREKFKAWLISTGLSARTVDYYLRYFDRLPSMISIEDLPGLINNKWIRNVIRKVVSYQYLAGKLSLEHRLRFTQASRYKPERREFPKEIPTDLILQAARHPLAGRIYLLLAYTGARLSDLYLTSEATRRGQVAIHDLGNNAIRIDLNIMRGRKRLAYLWLSTSLLHSLQDLGISYETARNYPKRYSLLGFKYIRKWYYQRLTELIPDSDLRELLQNRLSEQSVGAQYYANLLRQADQVYSTIVLPFLDKRLKEAVMIGAESSN